MSHKAHDHVHRLIRSMDRAEKRYFKLYAGRHGTTGQNNAQLLFDAIGAMDVYDELFLLKKFKRESFVKHFAITKRRLYEQVLQSLDAYHANSSADAKVHRLLHQVELLFGKALYDDAEKILNSTRKLARQLDNQAALINVLQWERRLIETANYSRSSLKELDRIAAESAALIVEQTELDQLWDLKSRVLIELYRQGQTRSAVSKKELSHVLKHPILRKDPKTLRTARAKFLFHHIQSAAAFANGGLDDCKEHLTTNFALLLNERDRFEDEPNLVISTLSNLIYVHVRLGLYDDAFTLLDRFRTIPGEWKMPETEDLDLKLFSTSTSLELTIHAQMGAFDKAVELVPCVERGLAHHNERISPVRKAGFFYQLAYAYFGVGEPDKALKWSNRLLNDVHIDDSAEIVCFGRVLNLMAYIELDQPEQIPYALRSTERYFATRQRAYKFEPYFLELMHAIVKAKNGTDLRVAYQHYHDMLIPLEHDPMEHAVFDHLDPIAWAQSKLTGLPFAKLVKQRAQNAGRAA
ncbi:MAG: hypothetical protein WAR83_01230 [Flavobacteriales bacterium]|jgi:hypothetical protein|nr:hypothetical protein [Flavobacteriales bacterium]